MYSKAGGIALFSALWLVACGDGGPRAGRPPVVERPRVTGQSPLAGSERPPPNPEAPTANPQRPITAELPHVPARAGTGPCRAADDCVGCGDTCEACECLLGASSPTCSDLCS